MAGNRCEVLVVSIVPNTCLLGLQSFALVGCFKLFSRSWVLFGLCLFVRLMFFVFIGFGMFGVISLLQVLVGVSKLFIGFQCIFCM